MNSNDETETGLGVDDAPDAICGHEACACVADDSGFCSDHCRERAIGDEDDDECSCGHSECVSEEVTPEIEI